MLLYRLQRRLKGVGTTGDTGCYLLPVEASRVFVFDLSGLRVEDMGVDGMMIRMFEFHCDT